MFVRDLVAGVARALSPPGAGFASDPAISADGRRVAYTLTGDDAAAPRLVVQDLDGGAARAVTGPADGAVVDPQLSADGSRVAYALVGGGTTRIEVRDLATGAVELASRADGSAGAAADAPAGEPSLSADGRLVAFASEATNLSPAKPDGTRGVFVRDLARGDDHADQRAVAHGRQAAARGARRPGAAARLPRGDRHGADGPRARQRAGPRRRPAARPARRARHRRALSLGRAAVARRGGALGARALRLGRAHARGVRGPAGPCGRLSPELLAARARHAHDDPGGAVSDDAGPGSVGTTGSAAVVGSVATAGSLAVAGSAATAGSVAVAGSVATASGVAVAGSVATLLGVAIAGCILTLGCLGCRRCVACVACVGCVDCVGCVGCVNATGLRGACGAIGRRR